MIKVNLFVYTDTYINEKKFLTADTTLFTADTTLITADATKIGGEGFFDIANKIELFEDEKISITSAIQDVQDVSKAKADFSQSFNIPASRVNNKIFKHWYENAIVGGHDHRKKYFGFIEINNIPFRQGGFVLNSVTIKDNRPYDYNITFYGDAVSIKDIVGDDKLNVLDYSSISHVYDFANVVSRITTNTDVDVFYPLLGHNRFFDYYSNNANDVNTNDGAIDYRSLFPAVRVKKIIDLINEHYSINIFGNFLSFEQFDKLHLLYKNDKIFEYKTPFKKLDFKYYDPLNIAQFDGVDLVTDEVNTWEYFEQVYYGYYRLYISNPTSLPYDLMVYRNGQYYTIVTKSNVVDYWEIPKSTGDKWTFFIRTSFGTNMFYSLIYKYEYIDFGGVESETFVAEGDVTTVGEINFTNLVPDLKIIDLISGLVKMFNLVILPKNNKNFELIPLELYYNEGNERDITSNIITESIELKKPNNYKGLDFKYQDSENILNNAFNDTFEDIRGYKYGNLKYEDTTSVESSLLSIDLPFENPLYERRNDSNFLTTNFIDKNQSFYKNKPLLLYRNEIVALHIRMKDDIGTFVDINSYQRASNELNDLSINWGAEISAWTLATTINSLFERHYKNYVQNIFGLQSRLMVVKTKMSALKISEIKLNDRIIIQDKKYTINKFTADITTGDVNFELLTDFRAGNINVGNRFFYNNVIYAKRSGEILKVNALLAGADKFSILQINNSFISYAPSDYTDSATIDVVVEPNLTNEERYDRVSGTWDYNGEKVNGYVTIIQPKMITWGDTDIYFNNTLITFENV